MNQKQRMARKRTYVMCAPEYFAVEYSINPWMDTTTPVDAELALKQWERLRETLVDLGHTVHLLPPAAGLPDMVFAANGAFAVDGVVYGARFRHPQRVGEAALHREFHARTLPDWDLVVPNEINEGEGDFAYLAGAYGGVILAGHGFRTAPAAHAEAQEALGRPVVSLRLVDPRYYHLDTALVALDDHTLAYYPDAFSAASRRVLRQLFPDAVLATAADAAAFGLNLLGDGRHVVLHAEATAMAARLAAAGYVPVPVELSELKKGGGSVKCCVAEIHR